jgi:signal transduction histidine kinase
VHPLLRSVWDERRPATPPVRVWRDWLLIGVLAPTAVLEGFLRPELPWRWLEVIVTVALLPTLLWRRTRPLPMVSIGFGVSAAFSLAVAANVPQLYSVAYLLLLPYALFRWGSGREAVLGLGVMCVKVCALTLPGYLSAGQTVGGFGVLSTVTALGAALRYRARARARELDQVKLLERERLARDLHDTVAHHVSAIAIRAQAGLATAALNPQAATDALQLIEAEASRTLDEMRSMVRVLRHSEGETEPANRAPTPQVAELKHLEGSNADGPAVEVRLDGRLDDLPPAVSAALYRLAQEAITNARRHARHPTRIEVTVNGNDDTVVHLHVADDGEPVTGGSSASSGFGLIGMIERVNLLGGTCAVGPGSRQGWTVTATIPRKGWSA